MLSIADELASQYVVVYTRHAGKAAAKRIEVSANQSGVKVRKAGS